MELSIRTEYFNPKFLYINLNNRRSSFFNIFYRTPTVVLNNLVFETPWMDAPFGICQYDNDEDRKKDKYYLDLSFNGYQYDIEIKNFYRTIENIDNYISTFLDNHMEYLGIDPNQGYIYNRQVRFNKNNNKYSPTTKKFPPTIKLKIFRQTTQIKTLNGKVINFEDNIPPGSKAQALISCRGLWSYDNSFGLSWKVEKVIIKSPTFLSEYPFLSDEEENDSDDEFIQDIIQNIIQDEQLEELNFETLTNKNNKKGENQRETEIKNQEDTERSEDAERSEDTEQSEDTERSEDTEQSEDANNDDDFDDMLVGSDLTLEEKERLKSIEITDENLLIEEIKKNPEITFDFDEEKLLTSLS